MFLVVISCFANNYNISTLSDGWFKPVDRFSKVPKFNPDLLKSLDCKLEELF